MANSRLSSDSLRRDGLAGLTVACASLPICLATGLLVFAPLGPAFVPLGIAAAFYGYIVGGGVAAFTATSSFIVSSPRASTALVQASLLVSVGAGAAGAREPLVPMAAMALCVLFAGLVQLAFGALGVSRIIKFTPHPVLAGFINGIALLIILSQLKPFFSMRAHSAFPAVDQPLMLAFVTVLAGAVLYFGKLTKKIPAGLAGLVAGTLVFYIATSASPSLDLGSRIGAVALAMPPDLPMAAMFSSGLGAALQPMLLPIALTSLTLAFVATLESLLSFRAAQNLTADASSPGRDLLAQGIANCASSLVGGAAITASPLQSTVSFRAGGRSRAAALSAIFVIAAVAFAAPGALAAIPIAVLSALLVCTGVLLFDRWSLDLLRETLRSGRSARQRRAWADLGVVGSVMLLTAAVSIAAGIALGLLLAGLIFIVNMSRPVIRREHSGEVLASKRVRPAADAAILRRTGPQRRTLELQGVLFFGNADDLTQKLRRLFTRCDTVILDLRGVTDIDASGTNILQAVFEDTCKSGKRMLFCGVPASQSTEVQRITAAAEHPAVFPDIDAALEWAEEQVLASHGGERATGKRFPVWQHPILHGLDAVDRATFEPYLVPDTLPAGSILCAEGEPADRMWLLTQGSVSVRVRGEGRPLGIRLSSCAAGTVIGEIALLQFGLRSATVVADEDVEIYRLSRHDFEALMKLRPEAGAKVLKNMAAELAQRLRDRSEDLRHALN